MKTCIAVCLSLFSCFASANAFVCGNSQSVVMNSERSEFPYFVVATFSKDFEVSHKFRSQYRYFKLKCAEDVNGKKYIFIKTNAGGSGSLDNYSLIDTTNGKLVITSESKSVTPEERRQGAKINNLDEVTKILGVKPEEFSCKVREQTDKEICMISNVQLG